MADFKIKEKIENDNGVISFSSGDIIMYTSVTVPSGWALCNGQLLNVSDYPDLYAAVGTFYGSVGAPVTQFRLPDLNNQNTTFTKYPTGVVGSPTSYTAPTYAFHTHAASAVTMTAVGSNFVAAHNHSAAATTVPANQNHGHNSLDSAFSNAGWTAASGDVANYSSTGTAGGISDSNHTHGFFHSYGVGGSNASHTHAQAGTIGVATASGTHTHTVTETVSYTSASHDYPDTYLLRFIVKL
jgi:microcystin-dependent protein